MRPNTLDHVAIKVADRSGVAAQLCEHLDVRVIDQTERFTLLGPHAHAGKITLFDAPPDAEPRARRLVSLMLAEQGAARPPIMLESGLALTFGWHDHVPTDTARHALIGLTLRSEDPPISAARYASELGFSLVNTHRDVASVRVAGGVLTLVREPVVHEGSMAMLDHIGLLVDSAREHENGAREAGIEVVDVVDAPNTLAVFVRGPEGVKVEFVEHKPEFALA